MLHRFSCDRRYLVPLQGLRVMGRPMMLVLILFTIQRGSVPKKTNVFPHFGFVVDEKLQVGHRLVAMMAGISQPSYALKSFAENNSDVINVLVSVS